LRQGEGEAGEHERTEDGLRDALGAGEVAEGGERDEKKRGREGEQPEPGGRAELEAAEEGVKGCGGHGAEHRR
jgi:hypothetical protein